MVQLHIPPVESKTLRQKFKLRSVATVFGKLYITHLHDEVWKMTFQLQGENQVARIKNISFGVSGAEDSGYINYRKKVKNFVLI